MVPLTYYSATVRAGYDVTGSLIVNADGDQNITTDVDTGAFNTASFGILRGDDRIIHWREIFNIIKVAFVTSQTPY